MTGYKKAEVDETVLSRVSEEDVRNWLVARIARLRQDGLPVHALSVSAIASGGDLWLSWTAHAAGHCAASCATMQDAERELKSLLLDNPERQAANRRAEARRLLAEAEGLELHAQKVREAGGSRGATSPTQYPEHKPNSEEMHEGGEGKAERC